MFKSKNYHSAAADSQIFSFFIAIIDAFLNSVRLAKAKRGR